MLKNFIGLDQFIWWQGVVEDRNDPLFLGRAKVRIFGWHTEDKTLIPTEHLPWANTLMPPDNGNNPVGPKEGDWVVGFFRDSLVAQEPIILGVLPGINTQVANPEVGFNDATPPEKLFSGELPRSPEFGDDINFAESMVTGIENAAKDSLTSLIGPLQSIVPEAKGLMSVLPQLDSKSFMNIAQGIVQNPGNMVSTLANGNLTDAVNKLGITSIGKLAPAAQASLVNGLNGVVNHVINTPGIQTTFINTLNNHITSNLNSFVNNNIPKGVKSAFNKLGPGNPLNKLISTMDAGGGFDVKGLFDGNITNNVTDIINSIIPLDDPQKMLAKLGEKAAQKIADFLGLEFGPGDTELVEKVEEPLSPLLDESKVPFVSTGFGMLQKEFSLEAFPFDLNRNGTFDLGDIEILIKQAVGGFIDGAGEQPTTPIPIYPMSRYPLEPFLNKPTTSPLAIGNKVLVGDKLVEEGKEAKAAILDNWILNQKKKNASTFSAGSYQPIPGLKLSAPTESSSSTSSNTRSLRTSAGDSAKTEPVGALKDQEAVEGEPFEEPASPYNAVYPYNHVYQSESGHAIEIDDSPGAERLHWYHRSGSFREMHPNGIIVDKAIGKFYTLSKDDLFVGSEKNIFISSTESTKMKADTEWVLESGTAAITTGAYSIKSGTIMQMTEGGHAQKVVDNKETTIGGDYIIKVKGKLKIQADTIEIDAKTYSMIRSDGFIINEAPIVGNNADEFNVSGVANLRPTFAAKETPNPVPPLEEEEEEEVVSPFKPGFVLKFKGEENGPGDPYNDKYLYKPVSDSNGKPVILNPPGSGIPVMYEAIPTPEFEDVLIEYRADEGPTTKWPVRRPVHKKGRVIEAGVFAGNANGGRDHYRFSKKAKDYPKQFIVADGSKEFMVYDGKIRHD
jgi:hypothetical protein